MRILFGLVLVFVMDVLFSAIFGTLSFVGLALSAPLPGQSFEAGLRRVAADPDQKLLIQLVAGLPATFFAAWIGGKVARRGELVLGPIAETLMCGAMLILMPGSIADGTRGLWQIAATLAVAAAGGAMARRGRLRREARAARGMVATF